MWISEISRVRGLPVRSIERFSETAARASSAAAPPDRGSSGRLAAPELPEPRHHLFRVEAEQVLAGGDGGRFTDFRRAEPAGPLHLDDGDREAGGREEH